MPDIFDEIEEEFRAERTRQWLTRYAGALITAAVLIVFAVAGWQGWQWYQGRRDQAAASTYIEAMLQADATGPDAAASQAAALAGFSQLARRGSPAGYRTLARLRAAALLASKGRLPPALAMWNDVAADPGADPLLRDLATLMWAQHQLDKGDPDLLEARLRPLAVPDNPWHAMAREQLALLALRQGKTAAARTQLTALARDMTAPAGVRERVTDILAQLQG